MNISLENWLRNKLQENEEMHDYAVSTETVKCWIDEYKELSHLAVIRNISNGFSPTIYISDDLEDLKRRYTPEQLKKMWEDACPKLSEISGKVIITGTPK